MPRPPEPIARREGTAELLASGEAHLAGSRFADAEECFRRVVYLEPHHEQALVRLAEIAERTQRRSLADRFRARALRVHLENEAKRIDGDQ